MRDPPAVSLWVLVTTQAIAAQFCRQCGHLLDTGSNIVEKQATGLQLPVFLH